MSSPARVHQISVSQGGVPKLPVSAARVEVGGVVGDAQTDLKHHGGPEQDLCLYSLEVIEALQAEGHPIQPGYAGENLTLAGIDWSTVVSGARLRIGAMEATVTWPAAPCGKNASWFRDGSYQRMDEELHPGWSRWYARVTTPGDIAVGDHAEVRPADEA